MAFQFHKMSGDPPWDKATLEEQNCKLDEFEEVCRPVVEYIQKKYDPHTMIIIGWASAVLASEEMGTPYEVPD